MTNELIKVPRVESKTSNKNTIEWEIPDVVLVVFMLIQGIGYTVISKVRTRKKHWWSRSWVTRTVHSSNPSDAIIKAVTLLEKEGYTIDHNTIQVGEQIGDPKYFAK